MVGVLCRVGCTESVKAEVRLKVASALVTVVARPWGPLEVRPKLNLLTSPLSYKAVEVQYSDARPSLFFCCSSAVGWSCAMRFHQEEDTTSLSSRRPFY